MTHEHLLIMRLYSYFQFQELNSQLNREVAEFERSAREGTNYLAGVGDTYEPSSELEAEARAHVLGGSGVQPGTHTDLSREERRQMVLQATMNRLRKEEEELEQHCGTAGGEGGSGSGGSPTNMKCQLSIIMLTFGR